MTDTDKPKCCCIPDQTKLDKSCQNEAEWELWPNGKRDGYTLACTAHVGLLMDDAPVTYVFPFAP